MVQGLEPLDDPAFATVFDALIADFRPDPSLADDTRPALWGHLHFDAVLVDGGFRVV